MIERADYVVPPITDPMGRHWEQPARESIRVDKERAFMDQKTFDALLAYNTSIPTGVYDGKMWKRNELARGGGFTKNWFLVWMGPCDDSSKCALHRRLIVIEVSA